MEDKFVSSMPSQSIDKALEGGLAFANLGPVTREEWVFTLEDDTTVTKKVLVSG